jgi:hypothetical protein
MRSTTEHPLLSDVEFNELLSLTKQADSVELKLTIDEPNQRSALTALGVDPLDAEIRQVFFFDTPDLQLSSAGVVVRARRVQGRGDDTVVKLRPVVPERLTKQQRRAEGFGVEVDAMPGGFVCSGSMKRALPRAHVSHAVAGHRAVRKLFSKEQRAFYEAHAPEGLALDDLSVLGPVFVLKLRMVPTDYKRKLVTELWLYPDDSRILELSTKCAPADALDVVDQTRAFLRRRGVETTGEQHTKTRRALEFFTQS